MPRRRQVFAAAVTALLAGGAASVAGGKSGEVDRRFAETVDSHDGKKPVRLVLTGTAMRTKYYLRVYAIASYMHEGAEVRDAEGLARADVVKLLHLIFERGVDGATMAQSFRDSIGMGYPAPAFAAELASLESYFKAHPVAKGDHIRLTAIPGRGLWVRVNSHQGVVVPGAAFARAVWETYMGRVNLGVAIKEGLSSRLR